MRSFLRHVDGRLAEDEGLAVGGKEQPQQQLDGRGLAGAVGAEKPKISPRWISGQGLQSASSFAGPRSRDRLW